MRARKNNYTVTVTEKQCFCCKETKEAKDFPRNSQLKGGLHTWCKLCVSIKHKINHYDIAKREARKKKMIENLEYREHILTQKNNNRKKNIATSLLSSCRLRAKQKNLEFNLTKEDIVIPELCPVLLKPLICGDKSDYNFSPSVDRIDNSKGYTKDNIQVISMKANKMKKKCYKRRTFKFCKMDKLTKITENQQNDRVMWYRLVNRVPVPSSMEEICLLQEPQIERVVKQEIVKDAWISTVFLSLDHSWIPGPPILFETMIFGGEYDGYQDRYSTWDEAEEGHRKVVNLVETKLLNGSNEDNQG